MNQSRPDQPTTLRWRKASASTGDGDNCIEVAEAGRDTVAVRDSKDPDGPRFTFSRREMRGLTERIRSGAL